MTELFAGILLVFLLVGALALFVAGRLIRLYAYHGGQGYGLGPANIPGILRIIPWPLLWMAGGIPSLLGLCLDGFALGIDNWVRLVVVVAVTIALGRFGGDLVFYCIFRGDMKTAYDHLDRFVADQKKGGCDEGEDVSKH